MVFNSKKLIGTFNYYNDKNDKILNFYQIV